MSSVQDRRYAVYWAPEPLHPLWRAGCDWLGRDPVHPNAPHAVPPPHTETPRRYGFHATLKAPFRLRPGVTEVAFMTAVQALAASVRRFDLPSLSVRFLGDFLALRPDKAIDAGHPLRRLADQCVRGLDTWRAPLSEADAARRMASASLSPLQRHALVQWGYPHVLDQWRFHLTLSDSLPAAGGELGQRLQAQAAGHFEAALREPLVCESIAVFVEPAPGAFFVLADRFSLAR